MRVSACPASEETLGGGRGRGAGTRGRVHADPGTRPAREGRHRSLARRHRHPPIGGRAVPSTERPKDVPTEGWPIAAEIDGAAPPAEKRPRAGVLPSPRARPSDSAIESILAETRVRHRTRGVRERSSRIARVPGPSRSRPIRPALDGTAWPREKARARSRSASGNRPGANREGRTRTYRGWTGRQP